MSSSGTTAAPESDGPFNIRALRARVIRTDLPHHPKGGDRYVNFIDAVRSRRQDPTAGIERQGSYRTFQRNYRALLRGTEFSVSRSLAGDHHIGQDDDALIKAMHRQHCQQC